MPDNDTASESGKVHQTANDGEQRSGRLSQFKNENADDSQVPNAFYSALEDEEEQ
jgi:hypothetical protein